MAEFGIYNPLHKATTFNIILHNYNFTTYNFPLLDIVEEDEVTEHGDEAEEAEARHNVDDGVLEVELAGAPLHDDHELDPEGLVQGSPPLLVEVGVPEVPPEGVQNPEVVSSKCEL